MARQIVPVDPIKPVLVEVIAYAPTQFFHCLHCEFIWQQAGAGKRWHQEQLEASMPLELQEEYARLSQWIRDTVEEFRGHVVFKVIDAASMEGLLKSVRYQTRRFPAFVVDRKSKYSGPDWAQARRLIEERLKLYQGESLN